MHWIYAHLIGDFIIQNDWMAQGKKQSSWICLAHVSTYMLPFLLTPLSWPQLGCIALLHFFQDRTSFVEWFMRMTGKRQFAQEPKAPWSFILVDAIFHVLAIMLIEKFLA